MSGDRRDPRWYGLARTVRPTLIVGLGGTGMAAAKIASSRMRDFVGDVPPFIAFRVFDTAFQDDREPRFAENSEYVYMGGFNAQAVVADVLANRAFKMWKDWLPPRLNFQQVTVGAGGIRPIGRLCYFYHRQKVEHAIRNALATITDSSAAARFLRQTNIKVNLESGLDIHLIFSVCGGTGAGMFLDLAFDLRRWAEQVTDKEVAISGHIVLPEAFRRKAVVHRALEANAYCGLQELDHFMNEKEPWRVQYSARKEPELARAPFDHCFLLNGVKHGGSVEIETLTALIGESVMLSSLFQVGKRISEGVINMAGQRKSSRDDEGNLCAYSSYGAIALELPKEFLRRSLGAELAQRARERLLATSDEGLSEEDKNWIVPGFAAGDIVAQLPSLSPDYSRYSALLASDRRLAQTEMGKLLKEAKERYREDLKERLRQDLWPSDDLIQRLSARLDEYFAQPGGLGRCLALIDQVRDRLRRLQQTLAELESDAGEKARQADGGEAKDLEAGRALQDDRLINARGQWEQSVKKAGESELLKRAGLQLNEVINRLDRELQGPWETRRQVLSHLRPEEPLDEEAFYRVNRARMSVCPTEYFSEILRPKMETLLSSILEHLLTEMQRRRMNDREINQVFSAQCEKAIAEALEGEGRIRCGSLLAEYYNHPSRTYDDQVSELLQLAHSNWEVNASYSLRQNLTEISSVGAIAESKFYQAVSLSHPAISAVEEERDDYLPILRTEHGLSLAGIKRLDDYEQSLQQAVFEEQRFDVHFFNHRRWVRHMRFASETEVDYRALFVFSMAEACGLLQYEADQRSYVLHLEGTQPFERPIPSRRELFERLQMDSEDGVRLREAVQQEEGQSGWKEKVENQLKELETVLDGLSGTRNREEEPKSKGSLSHLDIYQLHAECRALLKWLRREQGTDAWS